MSKRKSKKVKEVLSTGNLTQEAWPFRRLEDKLKLAIFVTAGWALFLALKLFS